MEDNQKKYTELANRIYDLDGAVYECVGSSLAGPLQEEERTVRTLSMLMYTKPDGHLLRSELALISNMARTIKNKEEKSRMMTEYNEILMEIEKLPDVFGKVDILDDERVRLNLAAKKRKAIRK